MAQKTVSQYKDSVSALLSGIDLNNVDDLNGAIERAARVMVQKADVPEASGIQNITLYNGVINYPCDERIFGTAINDIRPQGVSRSVNDFVYKRQGQQFDRTKQYLYNGTMTTFEYFQGEPIIRIVSVNPSQLINIDPMTATTDWVAAGSASGLVQDTTTFYHNPASMRFTLTGSSTGTLTKTLQNSLDMTSYEGVGVAFLAVYMPDASEDLTSVTLRLGSDSSNYSSLTQTEGFLGAWVDEEWFLIAFNMASATNTGTPDWSAIDYVQVRFAHLGTIVNIRTGDLWIALPCPAQILYQSAAIFKATGAQVLETITSNDDTIILSNPAYTLFQYEGALSILQQTGATDADPMVQNFKRLLDGNGSTDIGLYARFRGDNPSQELRLAGTWYDFGGNYGNNGY